MRNIKEKISSLWHKTRDNNLKELKSTNWIAELLKIFLTAIITGSFLFIIRKNSPGMFDGEKLKEYLKYSICNEIGINYNLENINLEIIFRCSTTGAFINDETIVAFGQYKNNSQEKIEGYPNRFIVLFEKTDKGFLNEFIGIEPKYVAKFIRVWESELTIPKTFYFLEQDIKDLDKDGDSEIIIKFKNNFADRMSQATMILDRNEENWHIVDIPFEDIFETETYNINDKSYTYIYDNNENYRLLINKFNMVNPKNKTEKNGIYFCAADSFMTNMDNIIDNRYCYLIKIATIGKNETVIGRSSAVYLSLLYDKGVLIKNNNWNNGKPLLVNSTDDFCINEHWGNQIDGMLFYTE